MKRITYSEVAAREQALQIRNVVGVTENSRLYFDRVSDNNTFQNALKFVTECAKDATVASYYFEDIQKYTDEYYKDPTIRATFESQIIPMIILQRGDTILEGHDWESLFKRTQVCDRILDNMQLIESKMPISEVAKNAKVNIDSIIELCCEAVCRYEKLSLVAKVNIALEEAVMLYEKYNHKQMDIPQQAATVSKILDNISIMEDVSIEQLKEVNVSLANSPVIEYDAIDLNAINKTRMEATKSFIQGDRGYKIIDEVFDHGVETASCMHEMLTVADLARKSPDIDIVARVFGNLSEIPEKFMDRFDNTPKGIKLYHTLCDTVNTFLANTEIPIKAYKECGSDHLEMYQRYQEILKEVSENLEEMESFIYPEYNMRMIQEGVFSKAKAIISFMKASDKLAKIGTKLLQARKWLKGKAQPMKIAGNIVDIIKTAGSNSKMLSLVKKGVVENASLYEYLTPEGDFDIIIDRYVTVGGVPIDSKVMDLFDNICQGLNDNVFNTRSTGCGSYFTATENMIEIRYFDNERVELTEQQVSIIVNETINQEDDIPLLHELMIYSRMPDDICELEESELIRRASDTLLENREATQNDFESFLELASYAGIWYDTVNSIFESVCEGMDPTFRTRYTYDVDNYTPNPIPDELALEALDFFKDFINEKVDYDKKYPDLDDEEEEDNSDDNDEDMVEDPVKEAKKKVNPKKDKGKDKKEKPKKEEKLMTFNNIKLFQMGLKKKMKDLNSKEQSFCRNLDSSFTRLVKAMQQALVSDRREAIIKGSVIPSLSKSIKWGCAIAGTSIINPIAPVITAIGAFALSKRLTKKERVLLLDDIEIELKVVEKEIDMAESNNNTKKMRALMKEQRNLQRQYQRIKYNIRVGKDIIPGRTGGDD